MPTTSNFGWTTPADTDLVKDGALAIRTLGNGIDTSFLDLKGGTTDQVLAKNSNTDLDFKWVAADDVDAIQKSLIDAEGDLIVGDAADAVQRLAIGSNGNVLTVDTAVDGKIKWAAPAAGGKVLQVVSSNITSYVQISSTSLTDTNITATITPSSATSKVLVIVSACVRTHCDTAANSARVATALLRGATEIQSYGDNTGDGRYLQVAGTSDQFAWITTHTLDSPNTTSATTYKLQARQVASGDNRYAEFQLSSEPSTITLLEIGA